MKLLLAGGKLFFLFTKSLYLPITKNILHILRTPLPNSVNNFNLDIVFKVAWAGFIKLKKLTYITVKKADPFFKNIHLTKLDIIFSEQDQYAMLRLKCRKTNTNHTGVLIMLAATKNFTCPVTFLRFLFTHHPQSFYASLFAFNNCSFSWQHVVNSL